jgi:hypothetical protein
MKRIINVCLIFLGISTIAFGKDEDLIGPTINKIANMVESDLESYKKYLFSLSEDEVLDIANNACKEGADSYFVGYYLLIPYFGEGLEKRENNPGFFSKVCMDESYHRKLRTVFATQGIYLSQSWSPEEAEQIINLAFSLWELPGYDKSLKIPITQALLKYLQSKQEFAQPKEELLPTMNRHIFYVHIEVEKVLTFLVEVISSSRNNMETKDSHYFYDATRILCQYISWYLESAKEVPRTTSGEILNARKFLAEMLKSTRISPEIKLRILKYCDKIKLGEFFCSEELEELKDQDFYSEKWVQDKIEELIKQSFENEEKE